MIAAMSGMEGDPEELSGKGIAVVAATRLSAIIGEMKSISKSA